MVSLTEGALERIMNGEDVENPIVQILGHKMLTSASSGDRYRLLLSDGLRVSSLTMLATQLNTMVTDNSLSVNTICKINRYTLSTVNNSGKQKRVMVLLDISVLKRGSEVGGRIGNPQNMENPTEGDSHSIKQGTSSISSGPQQKTNVAAEKKTSTEENIITTPINMLSPYNNRWVIKVRVTSKSDMRSWSNSRGEGKLFSMDLADESGEIRCTAFRDEAEKFFSLIEVGKLYYITRGMLKPANKKFSTLNNEFEMTLTRDSEITPCHDDDHAIPAVSFNFTPISEIEHLEKNQVIDILGIVRGCDDVQTMTARATGRELKKRDVHLVDNSNTMITLTLWGTQAEEFEGSENPVLAIKAARISEFNGAKNLSTIGSSVIQCDPDIPEAHKLRGWYTTSGSTENVKTLSRSGFAGSAAAPWLTIKEAKKQKNGQDSAASFFTVKAHTILLRSNNSVYKACPTEGCKKKVVDLTNGMYNCEKCKREYPNFKYRLLLAANIGDWSSNVWATAFNEEAEKLLGMSAQELGELIESKSELFDEVFAKNTFKSVVLKLRSKMEVYNDEARLRMTIVGVSPVDYKAYNDHLLTEIKMLAGIGKS